MRTSSKISVSRLGLYTLILFFCNSLFSFQGYTYQDAFNNRLNAINKEVKIRYQVDDIEQEKYLLEFMRHITTEIKKRYPNNKAQENNYYDNLENSLKEVDRLIPSLSNNKAQPNVIKLANDLRSDIQKAINAETINDNNKRKINKAIQMLSIIENSLRKGDSGEARKFSSTFESLLARTNTSSNLSASEKSKQVADWEKNEILKFKLDENRLVYYQKKLLKFATPAEKTRMARDFFGRALYSFNVFEYKTALSIMNNMLENYTFLKNKALVHYYVGLAHYYENNFLDAQTHLEEAIKNNSTNQYAAFVLSKIYRVYQNVGGLKKITPIFEKLSRAKDDLNNDFYFTVGTTLYELEKYPDAFTNLSKVSATYSLYNDASYMMASITFTRNKDEAKSKFEQLIDRPDIHPELRNNAILKIAYIAFESKKYDDALFWYDEINADDTPDYEKVLIGKAWAFYEKEMLKPEESIKTFKQTKYYTGLLINNYTSSDYLSEAKALLGYAKQKSNNDEGAENEFKDVFESKAYKLLSDEYLNELDSLRATKRRIDKLIDKSVAKDNMAAFTRLEDLKYDIDKKIYRLTYMDNASASPSNTKDFKIVTKQIEEFERLKLKAIEKKEDAIIKRIDDNLVRLYVVLNQFKGIQKESIFGENYFKDQALARKVSLIQNRNNKYENMSQETQQQQQYISSKIIELKKQRDDEEKKNNYKKVNQIDVTVYRLEKALARLNSINSYAKGKKRFKLADNLDKWANYSAYQLTNLQYSQREKLENENVRSLETLGRINEVVRNRNIVLAEQIKQIDNRIVNLTRQESRERRIFERNQTRESVEKTYFDDTTTEINEDSVRQVLNVLEKQREDLRNSIKGVKKTPVLNDSTKTESTDANNSQNDSKSGDTDSANKENEEAKKDEEQ